MTVLAGRLSLACSTPTLVGYQSLRMHILPCLVGFSPDARIIEDAIFIEVSVCASFIPPTYSGVLSSAFPVSTVRT